jgi:hypothetical protein
VTDDHRWSGWPGAWCLDCGREDARERCCADHWHGDSYVNCGDNGPCPEPGSGRNDPYARVRHV